MQRVIGWISRWMGRGGALVDFTPFVRRVAGSNPALAAMYMDLGQVLHLQLPMALRRETPSQYPCCVRSASDYSGLEEALYLVVLYGDRTKWHRTKWHGQNSTDKMVYGQNGMGQNGMDKMVWTKWYGQMGVILEYIIIQVNSILIF